MDKVKIDIPTSVYDEWIEACEIFGQKIMVRKRISYEEMVDFATEYAQQCCVIDTEAQVAYETNEDTRVADYLTLKYYSNVDVDVHEDPMAYASNLMRLIEETGFAFYKETNSSDARSMGQWFMVNTIDIYNRYHSIGTKLIKSFGSLLNSGDLLKEIAESRGMSERILDVMQNQNNEQADNIMLFKQFAKKPE